MMCVAENMEKDKGPAPLNRRLTAYEQTLVRWLLEHSDNPAAGELILQIERLSVFQKCTCGCPTVDFAIDGEPVARKGERIISDHLAKVDGQDVGVMLFVNNDRISSLEVYSCAGADKPFGLPAIESIYPWENLPKIRNNRE